MLNECTFTRPLFACGKPTRYISVLSLLNTNGPMNRYEILKHVWGIKNAVEHKEWYRGHMSSLFASMHRSGIVTYSNKTYKWSITDAGKHLLDKAKRDWGARYAEKYWVNE